MFFVNFSRVGGIELPSFCTQGDYILYRQQQNAKQAEHNPECRYTNLHRWPLYESCTQSACRSHYTAIATSL